MSWRTTGAAILVPIVSLGGCAFWILSLARSTAGSHTIVFQWLAVTGSIFLLFALVSRSLLGKWGGFLIDERNRISLSRVQLVCWNVLLLGGYFTLSLWAVGGGNGNTNLPEMDYNLWLLIGITNISPLASSLILQPKASPIGTAVGDNAPAGSGAAAGSATTAPPNVPPAQVTALGLLDKRTSPAAAGLMDLFVGEEVANRQTVDISRLQQVVFTLILLLTYGSALASLFANIPDMAGGYTMPPVSDTFVGLLGISHASYLAAKAVPKPPSA